jgi:thymidylate synthase (FAD)
MKIKLLSWTKNPLETIYLAFMNMHNIVPDDVEKIKLSEEEISDFFDMLLDLPHQTVLEFVNTNWLMEGVSRAFQQQLTRTRLASYSNQSLRIVDVGEFANEKRYTKSKALSKNYLANMEFDKIMKYLQNRYQYLLDLGCPVEDARGILPLNIHSPITMSINMRSLYSMLELRFCNNAQEEYREVAEHIKKEIVEKIHPIFGKPMKPICFAKGFCPSPVPCGQYNFETKMKIDVSRWIKG